MSKEVLSAAIDDAATDAEWDALLDAMEQDPGLKAEWSRACALRDAREGVRLQAPPAARDLCRGVMAAIAADPAQGATVVSMAARHRSLPKPARHWQTLVPLSAAAGVVAAVLFVGVPGPAFDTAPAPLAQASQAIAAATPVSWSPADGGALPDDDKAAVLNAYLMEHSNSLAERSMGGTLANARFAARTASYRPDGQ